ncbi:MAG: CheR family methyltransferase [Promethearchaeati archaeon]
MIIIKNKSIERSKKKEVLVDDIDQFPVVGIGASAGGLDAFKKLFSNIPKKHDIAYILVQHLDPNHESTLDEILRKFTSLNVIQINETQKIEPNTIYVISPNHRLSIEDSKIKVEGFTTSRSQRMPIDFLFRSMAREFGEKSIGILLSGTGTDGTLGLREIKGVNGMAIAQDPKTAEYENMPKNAIDNLKIDFILSPEKIPEKIIEYIDSYYKKLKIRQDFGEMDIREGLNKIFELIHNKTGHLFSVYKENMILRRIKKRMVLNQIQKFNEYVDYLEKNTKELENLFHEFLIGVTNFFRDENAFDALKKNIIPKLFDIHSQDDLIRIWVPGCSTGEEAYSIAILLMEYMKTHEKSCKVQIFATDIDSNAIETARRGRFLDNITADVSKERLDEFFTSDGNLHKIKKKIRNMIIFAEQNVLSDPPYSNVDLISCRNFLIYLKQEIQEKLLNIFHYALNQNGYLLLGKSESIMEAKRLFIEIDRSNKIFKYKQTPDAYKDNYNIFPPLFDYSISKIPDYQDLSSKKPESLNYQEIVKTQLLEHYNPPSILINQDKDILYIYGKTGKFLEPAEGRASVNIINMARKGLKIKLSTAIRKATVTGEEIELNNVGVKSNGEKNFVNLVIRPIKEPESMKGLLLVIFEPLDIDLVDIPKEKLSEEIDTVSKVRIMQLEHELSQTKQYLQSTIEELETKNEELKSTNEELQSSNEELRSTNEELQTSKEELQSLNEELTTVNNELQEKNQELKKTNDDLRNLINSTDIGTIFLDSDLKIKRYTPTATDIYNLIDSDIGRPISDIASTLQYHKISEDATKVLEELESIEKDLETKDNKWYRMRINLYRTEDNIIDGTVITFYNITERKNAEQALKKSEEKIRDAYNQLQLYKDLFTHDMRNILQVILSSMELASNILHNQDKNEKLKEYIDNTIEQTSKSFKLIKNIQRLSQIDIKDKKEIPLDLISILKSSKEYIINSYNHQDIQITINAPEEKIPVLASNLLEDVFENLFINAIKYNESDLKQIFVKVSFLEKEKKKYAKIEIEDNGYGISQEIKDRLFKDKLESSSQAGMGIGLLIVKKILNLYEGEIWVENRVEGKPSEGTRFVINLPKI